MLAKNLQGAAAAAVPAYVEDCFSTYLYTGNGSTQTITNGIDLSGKGGLVWLKDRSNANGHFLTDTARGVNSQLRTHSTAAATGLTDFITAFGATGFTLGSNGNVNGTETQVSWTFREQAKFFDVVTYTGNGTAGRTVAHNLGSVPGCIIVKRTDTTANWQVYHRSVGNTKYLVLNSTAAEATSSTRWNDTTPTSTVFSVGTESTVNASGGTYVAYLFAHDAGGFGASGSDNVISCGLYTGTGADNNAITLGYEPQFLIIKRASGGTGGWIMCDVMRGIATPTAYDTPATVNSLQAESSSAESLAFTFGVTATGFNLRESNTQVNANGDTYIYIAIRRGPMKTPTSGTSVFQPIARAGTGGATTQSTSLSGVDMAFTIPRDAAGNNWNLVDRLRGGVAGSAARVQPNTSNQEFADGPMSVMANAQNAITYSGTGLNASGTNYIVECFRRAPGFFDVVGYTGTGVSNINRPHNLTVVPEFIIQKTRDVGGTWYVYHSGIGTNKYLALNENSAQSSGTLFSNLTTTTFRAPDASTDTYITYLFATVAGVSKVGSYTGTGTTQQVNCGFTGGARFVLIKRADSTGDWYVWDSARGIVAGNDPYLLLNSTDAEVTNTDYVDTFAAGFEISSTAPAAINANGGTFIFLSIA